MSQTILERGAIDLDAYRDRLAAAVTVAHIKNGLLYHYLPLGTSLFAVPYVAVLNAVGWSLPEDDRAAQRWLAAAVAVAIFSLLFFIARLRLSFWPSLLLAAGFWAGTPYASTMGTALWSHDFAAVFALAAIWYGLRATGTGGEIHASLLGTLLFSAYLCRPTLALLSPILLLFVCFYDWKAAIRTGLVVASLLAAFSFFSWLEFGELLPDYYMPKRLDGDQWLTAAYGNLFSPARGLFVYSPFLLLPLLMPRRALEAIRHHKAIAILLAWPVLHWISISKFPHWWGGFSYGPRLMSDVLPALYVFLVLFVSVVASRSKRIAVALVALFGIAAFLHTAQGLYNPYTAYWNAMPSIDETPERLFDWKDPQFLQTAGWFDARADRLDQEAVQAALSHYDATVPIGERIPFDASNVVFAGWSPPEAAHRWSRGHVAEITFRLATGGAPPGSLTMDAVTLGEQRLAVELNGETLLEMRRKPSDPPLTIDLPSSAWSSGGLDVLRLRLPDAHPPGDEDPRMLGVALRWFVFE